MKNSDNNLLATVFYLSKIESRFLGINL